jgi:hypothetical protein
LFSEQDVSKTEPTLRNLTKYIRAACGAERERLVRLNWVVHITANLASNGELTNYEAFYFNDTGY